MAEAGSSTNVDTVHRAFAARIPLAILFSIVAAQASEVEIRCARLDQEQQIELRARVQLTLHAVPDPPHRVGVECSAEEAWVVWEAAAVERWTVDESRGVVEGVLDLLEQHLNRDEGRDAPQVPSVTPPTGETLALTHDPEPRFESPPPPDRRLRPLPAGGVALGLDAEPRRDSAALGARLSLGAGFADLAVVATEAVRFGTRDGSHLFDSRVGCGWGAPFAAGRAVGVELFGGVQGLAGAGREVSTPGQRTDSALLVGGALRLAEPRGALAPQLSADLVWRAHRLRLDEPYDVSLSRWQVGVTLGVVYRATTDRER